jgi:hypothetical protein
MFIVKEGKWEGGREKKLETYEKGWGRVYVKKHKNCKHKRDHTPASAD